ncbi:MAG: M56 family metallopeptidase [Bacillota bacterium]
MAYLHPLIVYAFSGMFVGAALAALATKLPGLPPGARRAVWWAPLAVPFVLYVASWAWRWRVACWVPVLGGVGYAGAFLAWLCWAGTLLAYLLAPFFVVSLAAGVGKAAAGAWMAGRLWRRFGPEPGDSRVALMAAGLAERMGMKPPVVMVTPHPLAHAFTVGIWRPVVVLSRQLADQLDDEELAAVLAHELAHVKSCDHLKKWLGVMLRDALLLTGLSLPVFRRLQAETEAAADAVAARVTGKPLALASALIKGWKLGTAGAWWQLALDNFTPLLAAGEVQRRVERLLEPPSRSLSARGSRWVPAVVWVLTALILVPLC